MIKSFITSFKLKNTYRVNSIIYSIRRFPFVNKILPSSLYKSKGLKGFGNIISALIELGNIFIGKMLYILLMITSLLTLYKTKTPDTFLHLFTFLTLAGGLLNTFMFNPTKDKYYAMIIMNMDAKKYTLSNYYYELIKVIVGFLPFTIIFGLKAGVPLFVCTLLPFFVVMIKMIVSGYVLRDFQKTNRAKSENLPPKVVWVGVGVFLALAYGLPFLKVTVNQAIFLLIFLLSILLGCYSFIKINNFKDYKKMYKQLLTNENLYYVQNQSSAVVVKEAVSKQIQYEIGFESEKSGFAYFHELFVKRHKKILTEAVRKQSVVIFVILSVGVVTVSINTKISDGVNNILLTSLPYFVFIMYLLNRGTTYTQAMFMNCDHSMLSFRIFRTPRVILGLFKERLKTLIMINLTPALVIACGLPLLLFITGGTDNVLNYVVLFLSIVSMSIFFSVHYLVMYYLLQPYNVNTEMKSSAYKIVQMVTYFACYYMIRVQLPTMYFGVTMIIFSVSYSLISLYLAYKYAPKTYKLHN